MTALIIILLVLMCLLLLPLGIDGGYSDKQLVLCIKVGPFTVKILPKKKKRVKPSAAKPKSKLGKKAEPEETKKKSKKPDFGELREIIKLALEALGRFRRKLSIDYLRLCVSIGSSDPFDTAIRYAALNAGMSAFFPLLDGAFNIKERDYGIYSNFLSDKTELDIWLTATVNLLDLFYIAFAFGIDFLKLKLKQKRAQSKLAKKERNEANG